MGHAGSTLKHGFEDLGKGIEHGAEAAWKGFKHFGRDLDKHNGSGGPPCVVAEGQCDEAEGGNQPIQLPKIQNPGDLINDQRDRQSWDTNPLSGQRTMGRGALDNPNLNF